MNIDIVTGFFQSGKTTLIKKMIKNEASKIHEKILVINCEYGEVSYDDLIKFCNIDISVVNIYDIDNFNNKYIDSLIKEYNPEYVIIEYNGVWDLSKAIEINYSKGFNIRNIISTIDYKTMDNYISNMEQIMLDKISNSDIVVITKEDGYNTRDMDLKYNMIRHINRGCKVYLYEELFQDDENDIVTDEITQSDKEILKFAGLFILLNSLILVIKVVFPTFYDSQFQKIIGVFLSLLIQIIPFLIVGAIISSIIQILIPQNKFRNIFAKSDLKSIVLALFAGVFFPVCDCAMVPIATSIVKKGYSTPVAITFLLASPAVNPIVMLSTYYAFPTTPKVVIYRVIFGLTIAFLVGIILLLFEKYKNLSIVKDHIDKYRIIESNIEKPYFKNKVRYLESVVLHTKKEIFKMGFYVVIGAFISACLQVSVPKSLFAQINNINAFSVFVMIIAAFFISVCSTSNSFIARSFMNIMPANAILGFMVMGPILDITNLSVMLGTFKSKFVLSLIVVLMYIAFVVFSVLGSGFSFA